jgi:PAS domain-containing protein
MLRIYHSTDEGRPCQRCIKRKIAHLCHDEATRGSGGDEYEGVGSAGQVVDPLPASTESIGPSTNAQAASDVVAAAAAAVAAGANLSPAVVAAVANALPTVVSTANQASSSTNSANAAAAGSGVGAVTQADLDKMSAARQQLLAEESMIGIQSKAGSVYSTFPTLNNFPPVFASEHMGNEFTILTEFLASLDENSELHRTSGMDGTLPKPISAPTTTTTTTTQQHAQGLSAAALASPADPTAQLSSTEKFVLTAADPADGTYDDRLNQVITAKYEAGLLKPYNYVNSYAKLNKWMETHMSPASRQRILNVMGVFRPRFRWIAQSLTDMDLVMVEEAFERLLLEYDRVFSSMGIPSCLWRRTGEIWKCNKEFAQLVGLSMEKLKDGRMSIYELMTEESAVNYWEKYGNIAFDAGQKAVLTSCVLKNPEDGARARPISCCFSFTIRRDRYNIPLMVSRLRVVFGCLLC